MKIIHCADLHLDSNMTSNLSREQAKQRKAELLATFERMIAYAKDNSVKAVIIAGDLYDKKNISANARNVFLSAINNNPDITFYYLRGNHDAESLFIDCDTIPDNIKMFNDSWTSYTIEAPEDNSVITINGVELTADNSNVIYNSLVLDISIHTRWNSLIQGEYIVIQDALKDEALMNVVNTVLYFLILRITSL